MKNTLVTLMIVALAVVLGWQMYQGWQLRSQLVASRDSLTVARDSIALAREAREAMQAAWDADIQVLRATVQRAEGDMARWHRVATRRTAELDALLVEMPDTVAEAVGAVLAAREAETQACRAGLDACKEQTALQDSVRAGLEATVADQDSLLHAYDVQLTQALQALRWEPFRLRMPSFLEIGVLAGTLAVLAQLF